MPIPAAVPIGVGAVVVTGLALRIRAVAKKKAAAKDIPASPQEAPQALPPTPAPQANIIPAAPAVIVDTLPALITNPDGSPHTVGTPFVAATNADAQSIVAEANRRGISVQQLLLERSGQLSPSNSGDGVAAIGQRAIVTTNDPAPAGDLIIRSSASGSARQIGGAEKDGIVLVLDSSDSVFARIQWDGGSRLPAATGFARKAFLKLI